MKTAKYVLVALFQTVSADQPVHCLRENLYGTWDFHVSAQSDFKKHHVQGEEKPKSEKTPPTRAEAAARCFARAHPVSLEEKVGGVRRTRVSRPA